MARSSILTGSASGAALPAAPRSDITAAFAAIAEGLQAQASNSEKLSGLLSGWMLGKGLSGPVDLSEQAIEAIKAVNGGIAVAVMELGVQVHSLRQAIEALPAPPDVDSIRLGVDEAKTALMSQSEAMRAEIVERFSAIPAALPVPVATPGAPPPRMELSPAQLKKVLAPVHLTVDVERRFDGRIERFIVNEV